MLYRKFKVNIIIKEENLRQREDNMVIKEHDLFTKEIGIGRPSLAQDLLKGRKIEVDYLNGYVSQKGLELGIQTPVNDDIRELAHRVARKEIEPSVENLELIN